MRKFIRLTIISFCFVTATQAQVTKGSLLLGGNVSASHYTFETVNSSTSSKTNGINFSPSIGFVTKDNTAWGINLAYSNSNTKNINAPGEAKSNSYGGGIFYRRYLTLGSGFYLFAQANGGYALQKQNATYFIPDTRTERDGWNVGINVYPGITYAVNKWFHLEAGLNNLASLNYGRVTDKTITNGGQTVNINKSKGLSFDTNFSSNNPLNIGFRFVL